MLACGAGMTPELGGLLSTRPLPSGVFYPLALRIGREAQFDPNAGQKVSDSKIHATDPITSGTSAYGPMLERISKTHIEHAVRLFEAENGRYPSGYDEFMEKIIKANKIELPVLPGGKKYQYDEANHALVVVDGPSESK